MDRRLVLILVALVWSISAQSEACYSDNFYEMCGNAISNTTVIVPDVLNVTSSELLYFVNEDYSSSCGYWGLGSCNLGYVEGFLAGVGVDGSFLYQNYTINNNNLNVSISMSIYQDSYVYGGAPLQVNVTVYNNSVIVDQFVIPFNGVCGTPDLLTYPPEGASSFTSIVISGNYFVASNISICLSNTTNNNNNNNNCGELQLFTGDDQCVSLSNQCNQCTDSAGTDFWYSANCTGQNTCQCQSYLYSQANCQGDVFVNPLPPSSCGYLSNFFPNANSVCMPFILLPQSYSISFYSGTAAQTCSQIEEGQCVTCSEFGENYSFSVACSTTQNPPCTVSQYTTSNCSGTPNKSPALNADCEQLATIYGSGSVCAFGYQSIA